MKACQFRLFVMEVSSPPRLVPVAESVGLTVLYDLKNGFGFRSSTNRGKVEHDLITLRPDLLMLCPPCTDEGGWFHLNSTKWDGWEYLRRNLDVHQVVLQIVRNADFCRSSSCV